MRNELITTIPMIENGNNLIAYDKSFEIEKCETNSLTSQKIYDTISNSYLVNIENPVYMAERLSILTEEDKKNVIWLWVPLAFNYRR